MSPDYQIPGRVPEDGIPRQAVSDYWRERFTAEPYYDSSLQFDDYEPAYYLGYSSRLNRTRADDMIDAYEQVEAELESRWAREQPNSRLSWEQARTAVRRGWDESTALHLAHLDKGVPRGT
jgi:hypothetical protein